MENTQNRSKLILAAALTSLVAGTTLIGVSAVHAGKNAKDGKMKCAEGKCGDKMKKAKVDCDAKKGKEKAKCMKAHAKMKKDGHASGKHKKGKKGGDAKCADGGCGTKK